MRPTTFCMSPGRTLPRFWCRRYQSNSRAISGASTAVPARSTKSRERLPRCGTRFRSAGRLSRRNTSGLPRSSSRGSTRTCAECSNACGRTCRDSLADLDRDIADLVDGYLSARAVEYRRFDEAGRVVFDVAPGAVIARLRLGTDGGLRPETQGL